MNRNKIYIAIGGLIAIILIGLLIYLMNSQSDLSSEQIYTVEIYHCGPVAKDSASLKKEMSIFLLSSALPGSNGFIAPVVNLHERLQGGESKRIFIPKSGLAGLRETFVSDYYDINTRKEEENDFIGEHGSFFSSEKYINFASSALKDADTAVNAVNPNRGNDTTEFFINLNQTNPNSADNKVWNSLASLKLYINGLIASNKIKAGSVIKVYYQCGVAPPITDSDGDGFDSTKDCNDNDAQINAEINEVCGDSKDNNCDGNIDEGCNIMPGNGDGGIVNGGVNDIGNDPITDEYMDFSIQNGIVSWTSGESEVYVEVFHNSNEGVPFLKETMRKNEKFKKIDNIENTNNKNYFFVKYGKTKRTAKYEKKIWCINFK
jgi:hypothetical protein